MARKLMMALFALAAIGLVQPTAALARGGGGGGMGGHGGMGGGGMGGHAVMGGGGMGGHGGWGGGGGMSGHVGMGGGGGGFRSAGIHGGFGGGPHGFHGRFHRRGFVGIGFGPYAYYDDYPYYYDEGCYIVRHRVLTRYGWRIRPVQVCG
jgi:hypothetical protein